MNSGVSGGFSFPPLTRQMPAIPSGHQPTAAAAHHLHHAAAAAAASGGHQTHHSHHLQQQSVHRHPLLMPNIGLGNTILPPGLHSHYSAHHQTGALQPITGHHSVQHHLQGHASSDAMHHFNPQPHPSAQYSAMNSFPGSDRLTRDFMSASTSAAVYSQVQHQSSHHPQSSVMDPMLMQSSWYPTGMMSRMPPVMSQRMPPSSTNTSGNCHRRSNESSSSSGAGLAAAAWGFYSAAGHSQPISMNHQSHSHHTSKYPVSGMCGSSPSSSYHHSQSSHNTGSNRSHAAGATASLNSHQLRQTSSHSFNNYLTNCGMQMMNSFTNSTHHLLPTSAQVMGHSTHPQQHLSSHLTASYPTASHSVSMFSTHGSANSQASSSNNVTSPSNSHNMSGSNNSHHGSHSRSNSVTPSHNLPVGQASGDGCSFSGYNNSPSSNSVHNSYSPYPATGRNSSSANNNPSSSHTPTPVSHGPSPVVNQTVAAADSVPGYESTGPASSGYSSGGSASSQGYPSVLPGTSTMHRLTPPSSAYPTPPSSVSQAQAVANSAVVSAGGSDDSSHGLHSHFPLTPQSGSSYYSSSSGYSSNSKCSTDSVTSAGSGTGGSSCMVAAAAAAGGYSSHMHSMSSETGIAEATQPSTSCLSSLAVENQHRKSLDPGPVSIAGGEADPNLGSVFTEQEIEFPSISYNSESDYSGTKLNQQSTPKKRKEKSKKDKKKKEKAKQVAAADRIALNSYPPFDVPVPHFGHQHPLSAFPGHLSLNSSVVMNPWNLMHTTHTIDHSDLASHQMNVGSSSFFSGPPSATDQSEIGSGVHQLSSQDVTQVDPQMTSHQSMSQQQHSDPALHSSAINNVPAQDQRMQEKDTFADLEDDLRLLTEGSSASLSCQQTTSQSEVVVPNLVSVSEITGSNMLMTNPYPSTTESSQQSISLSQPDQQATSLSDEAVVMSDANTTMHQQLPPAHQDTGRLDVAVERDNVAKNETEELLDFIQKSSEHENHDPATLNTDESHILRLHISDESAAAAAAAAAAAVPSPKKKKKKSREKSEKSKTKIKSEECTNLKPKVEQEETHEPHNIPLPQPQAKSSITSESFNSSDRKVASVSTAGDSKFFKNRPQNFIPATEQKLDTVPCPVANNCLNNGIKRNNHKHKDTATSTSSSGKKRKRRENDGHGIPSVTHDEYEFRESPSEHSRKKSKKTTVPCPATVQTVAPKASKKSSLSSTSEGKKGLSVISPASIVAVPSNPRSTGSKKQSAKSAKSTNNKSVAKGSGGNPDQDRSFSLQKCDNNHVMEIGCRAPCSIASKSTSKSAANHVTSKSVQQPQHESPSNVKDHVKDCKTVATSALHPKPQPPKSCDIPSVVPSTTSSKSNQSNGSSKKENSKSANVSVQSMGTNTPRRRSQDKKALTIKEGLMRTGDFVVSIDEMVQELPMIWRIEGKSLLQRFEPSQQDGVTVYTNTSSYSAWNPTVRQRYRGVDVRIMGCSRTKIVVEKLGLTKNHAAVSQNGDYALLDKSKPLSLGSSSFQHQENFEVFIQTLISQALDPNFIAEIVKENDDYFLTHVQAIDKVCEDKKQLFFTKVKWDASIVKCIETFPVTHVVPQKNENDLRCRLCHDNWSTQMFSFTGDAHDPQTLEPREVGDVKQTKYASCDVCKDRVLLFSRLHHAKYNFFIKCQKKVEEVRTGDETKESHLILEQCLQDNDWILSLFNELEDIWFYCDKFTQNTKIR